MNLVMNPGQLVTESQGKPEQVVKTGRNVYLSACTSTYALPYIQKDNKKTSSLKTATLEYQYDSEEQHRLLINSLHCR